MSHVYPPCCFCYRTDVAQDAECPWGCAQRNGPHPDPERFNAAYGIHDKEKGTN